MITIDKTKQFFTDTSYQEQQIKLNPKLIALLQVQTEKIQKVAVDVDGEAIRFCKNLDISVYLSAPTEYLSAPYTSLFIPPVMELYFRIIHLSVFRLYN